MRHIYSECSFALLYNAAAMVGYSDVAHFSKAFKQIEGIPFKLKNIQGRGQD